MRTLNIAQWAEEKGNFMLEHFLQLVPEDWYQMSTNYYVPWRQRDRETRINPIENRRVREGPANVADLRFVEEHLEEWFAVIGITERFEESMMLFAFAWLVSPSLRTWQQSTPIIRTHLHLVLMQAK